MKLFIDFKEKNGKWMKVSKNFSKYEDMEKDLNIRLKKLREGETIRVHYCNHNEPIEYVTTPSCLCDIYTFSNNKVIKKLGDFSNSDREIKQAKRQALRRIAKEKPVGRNTTTLHEDVQKEFIKYVNEVLRI